MHVDFKNQNHVKNNTTFKAGGGFYNSTAELENNVVLSRALIDLVGCDVPWVVMANNKNERIERARRYAIVFLLAFMSPMALLPVLNRAAMKNTVKLTKNFWSNNHKAIHISNAYLVSAEKTKEGLEKLAQKTTTGPIEALYYKVTRKKSVEQKLNIEELLKNAGGDYENLRKKLITAKNQVLFWDFVTSGVSLGSLGFINNYLTKKKTGQAGFSAELKMADKDIIEKRANNYEKNKRKRYTYFATLALGIPAILSLATKRGLTSTVKNGFTNFVKKHANLLDYKSGIYMGRLPFLILVMGINHGGLLLASRNKTEAKDTAVRMGAADAIFFGGDLLLGSIFANVSDRIFNTKLRKDNQTKNISKFLPKIKSLKQIDEEVTQGLISKNNKKAGLVLYWANIAALAFGMGFVIPSLINRMIRKDVKKDVEKEGKMVG